jgi:Flp pilus assembly protein TadG
MRTKPLRGIRSFPPREGGSVAIMFALLLIPLLLAVGVAVDSLRAYHARTALQQAVDSGALAAGAVARLNNADTEAIIENYVLANTQNLPIGSPQTTVTRTTAANEELLNVSVTAEMNTTFMRILGEKLQYLTLRAETEVRRAQPGPVQVALVLDSTHSMTQMLGTRTRLAVLKEAAINLTGVILDPPNKGGGVGLVPFTLWVNLAGVNLGDPASTWIDVPPNLTTCTWSRECYKPCTVDGASGECVDTSLPGCRQIGCTTHTFTGCTSYRPRGYRTILAEQETHKHQGVVAWCPRPTRSMMTNKATVVTRINQLVTNPIDTHIPTGLMWGWNMLTPELPIAGPSRADVEDKGGSRAIVLISDGENRSRPDPSRPGWFTAWQPGQPSPPEDNPDLLTAEICDNIKKATDPKITIFTVLIGEQTESLVDLMRNCATDTGKAFTATTASGLLEAFNQIGDQLTEVRIVK